MKNLTNNGQSRRDFLGKSAAALAAASIVPLNFSCANAGGSAAAAAGATAKIINGKINSKFNGVQIGTITYSYRGLTGGLQQLVQFCKESGVSSIELMSSELETFLGAPENPMRRMMQQPRPAAQPQAGGAGGPGAGGPGGAPAAAPQQPRQQQQRTPEELAAIEKYNADLSAFRKNVSMSKVEEARQMFANEGIGIHIVKFSPSRWSDDDIDYAFTVAKAMGAKAVTDEISLEAAQKLGPFAQKHDMYVAFHNHAQYGDPAFSADPILAVNPHVMLNFDAGHYFGSTGLHPNDFIRRYKDRIYSIHLKDKTGKNNETQADRNQVWGQGETPLVDILTTARDEKWPYYFDIELEYTIQPWTDTVKEVRNCVNFARQILI
ncbi:sugar phosphate isomerase/epimerase [Parabacteroides sp. OttesenSCG-928-G07]|nr:sugar phosphate isomerase/epimerase [Parabacteroides sp. OttesenSCG-928-G07]